MHKAPYDGFKTKGVEHQRFKADRIASTSERKTGEYGWLAGWAAFHPSLQPRRTPKGSLPILKLSKPVTTGPEQHQAAPPPFS